MRELTHLDWPFLEGRHRELGAGLEAWAARELPGLLDAADEDAACRSLAKGLGEAGWLAQVVPAPWGAAPEALDTRALCVARETLAWHSGLADFVFAMQGLGSAPISLFGTEAQRARWLPGVATGAVTPAFALTEEEAGSNVAATATAARRDGHGWVLDGEKTWISNAGIADFYLVFARTGEAPGARGLSAFVVAADAPGLEVSERIEVIAPHPLGTLRLSGCTLPGDALVGAPGQGMEVAMATLDVFRSTVGAAAVGFARRALDEAVDRATTREVFGRPLSKFQMTHHKIAEMAAEVDASALLVYRAAWARDQGRRVTREAATAKLYATEAAQRVIDMAVQLHGGLGVTVGTVVERLYRDIRPLRIYEGTSEIQRLVVAREVLRREEER